MVVSLSKIDLLQEIRELVAIQTHADRFLPHGRVPMLRGILRKAHEAFEVVVVAHEVKLVVEDELMRQGCGTRVGRLRLLGFRRIHLEQRAEHVIHREECRGHAATGEQELAPVHAQPASGCFGKSLQPTFDLALVRGLRQRVELAVRHHL